MQTAYPPPHDGTEPPARRVLVDPGGPVLVEGPVEVELPDGTVARSDRFMVAVCACRRSRSYPWCDTSHRRRSRGETAGPGDANTSGDGNTSGDADTSGDAGSSGEGPQQ